MSKEVAEVLRKALAGFGPNGEKWARFGNDLSYSPDGRECSWTGICAAIHGAEHCAEVGEADRWANVLGFENSVALFRWNDAPERTFGEVKERFEQRIAEHEAP